MVFEYIRIYILYIHTYIYIILHTSAPVISINVKSQQIRK